MQITVGVVDVAVTSMGRGMWHRWVGVSSLKYGLKTAVAELQQ